MNWEAIGAIGEIVGAVAVVVTLVYLIIQIKQNTRGTHAITIQTNVNSFNNINALLATNPELAEIFDRGGSDPASLTEREAYSYLWFVRSYMNLYQNLFDQFLQGTLPELIWARHATELKSIETQPGFLQFRESDTSFEEMWSYIDQMDKVDHLVSMKLAKHEAGNT